MTTTSSASSLAEHYPRPVGYPMEVPTLCIGLDMAWFGGSKGVPDSQYDCLVYGVTTPETEPMHLQMNRVRLKERDGSAIQIHCEIQSVIKTLGLCTMPVVLALDAPLQTTQTIPTGRMRAQRACERVLSNGRKAIDKRAGGAKNWHPNIQPGAPLAPRVEALLSLLAGSSGLLPWAIKTKCGHRVVIECFPAEALWAAKRLGGYQGQESGTAVKSYKKHHGTWLTSADVTELVNQVVGASFAGPSGATALWGGLIDQLLTQMLASKDWQKGGFFKGGKLLDDVIDSAICFATALSYANGNAHLWHDPAQPGDGHIIGPGRFPDEKPQPIQSAKAP